MRFLLEHSDPLYLDGAEQQRRWQAYQAYLRSIATDLECQWVPRSPW
jgi:hypothetical protein